MTEIFVQINGTPAPQGSKRHVGHGRMIESSKAVGPWRNKVRDETRKTMMRPGENGRMRQEPPISGPVLVEVRFYMPRPAYHFGKGSNASVLKFGAPAFPDSKPDLDKLLRAILDGVTAGGAINDDSQVVSVECIKRYAGKGSLPGAEIGIYQMIGAGFDDR